MKRLIHIFACLPAILLWACEPHHAMSEEFAQDDEIRMEIKGYTTFRYDPNTCQIGFNRENCEFRVHTDNMSDFYVVRLDYIPVEEGEVLNGTVSWTTGDDLHNKKTAFEAVKLEGSKIWLWSASTRIAMVVRTLE